VTDQLRAEGVTDPHDRVVTEFRTNRYNEQTQTLVFTDRQVKAFNDIRRHYAEFFGEPSTKYGLPPSLNLWRAELQRVSQRSPRRLIVPNLQLGERSQTLDRDERSVPASFRCPHVEGLEVLDDLECVTFVDSNAQRGQHDAEVLKAC